LRDVIQIRPVRSQVEDDVGYIRIAQFTDQATDGLKKAIADINSQVPPEKLKGYVLDLRNNPGGLLDQAISVSDAFLESGEIVSGAIRRRPGTSTLGRETLPKERPSSF
jgi:carboxyl-terminal processing protease